MQTVDLKILAMVETMAHKTSNLVELKIVEEAVLVIIQGMVSREDQQDQMEDQVEDQEDQQDQMGDQVEDQVVVDQMAEIKRKDKKDSSRDSSECNKVEIPIVVNLKILEAVLIRKVEIMETMMDPVKTRIAIWEAQDMEMMMMVRKRTEKARKIKEIWKL